jgi:hypothetical protein
MRSIKYMMRSIWYMMSSIKYMMRSIWYMMRSIKYMMSSIWYIDVFHQVHDVLHLAPDAMHLVPDELHQVRELRRFLGFRPNFASVFLVFGGARGIWGWVARGFG